MKTRYFYCYIQFPNQKLKEEKKKRKQIRHSFPSAKETQMLGELNKEIPSERSREEVEAEGAEKNRFV